MYVSWESPGEGQRPRKRRGVRACPGSGQKDTSYRSGSSAQWSSVLSRVTELRPDPSSLSSSKAAPSAAEAPSQGAGAWPAPHTRLQSSPAAGRKQGQHTTISLTGHGLQPPEGVVELGFTFTREEFLTPQQLPHTSCLTAGP